MRNEVPIPYILIQSHLGYRAYAEKELSRVFSVGGLFADGSILADGSELADGGGAGIIEKSARVLSFSSFERSLQSLKEDILGSYQSKTLQSMSIELENSDRYFSQIIASEPFIGRPLKYYIGFESLPIGSHLKIFSGIITEMTVMPVMTLEANEE